MFLLYFLVVNVTYELGTSQKSFMPVLSIPYGDSVCAVDEASNIVDLPGVGGGGFPDVTQCAMQCTVYDCSGFNLKETRGKCEIYSHKPTRFTLMYGCAYGQVSRTTSIPVTVRPLLTKKISEYCQVMYNQCCKVFKYVQCLNTISRKTSRSQLVFKCYLNIWTVFKIFYLKITST